jgi:N-acetylglucosaminyldiphosphoundecaprenol N-acetyl-beta-D-mannosaminyltransferase
MRKSQFNKRPTVLGVSIDATSYEEACQIILNWQTNHETKMVCFANVHMVMTAFDSEEFRSMLNHADLVTPDGMPLVWALRLKGYKNQKRVYGPTLTQKLLPLLEKEGVPIGFYGSSSEVLEKLHQKIKHKHPKINIAYAYSPPFRELTEGENHEFIRQIKLSGARILFVGLGCPKQEIWMHEHKDCIQAVMLGVGAAFDFLAGVKPQAPLWVQRLGLEWLYRLLSEPKRLWWRYFYTNPRFILAIVRELLAEKY